LAANDKNKLTVNYGSRIEYSVPESAYLQQLPRGSYCLVVVAKTSNLRLQFIGGLRLAINNKSSHCISRGNKRDKGSRIHNRKGSNYRYFSLNGISKECKFAYTREMIRFSLRIDTAFQRIPSAMCWFQPLC
jgi:hypothetical protein